MAELDEGLFKEFQEFMTAKQEAEAQNAADDDEVEIWNEKGQGARVRRSVAKPFLQSLGIDMDPDPSESNDPRDNKQTSKTPPKGRQASSQPANGLARKYFVKK